MRTHIAAGDLRHVIQIGDVDPQQDSGGATVVDNVTTYTTQRASVETLQGKELFAAQQSNSQVTHKITMRWFPGIVSRQKVWFDGRQYDIESVQNPDGRRKMLVLMCIERNDSVNLAAGSAL